MISKEQLRTTQVLINGEWETCIMSQLEKGDVIRMFEPNGDPVTAPDGCTLFEVQSPATIEVDTKKNDE